MQRTIIAVLLLLIGLSTGCNRGKDSVESDGTRMFGQRTLNDGTKKFDRQEFSNGNKFFDVTVLPGYPNQAETVGRVEHPNGEKWFDVTYLPDDTVKIRRIELADGTVRYDVTKNLMDGTETSSQVPAQVEPVFATDQNDSAGFDEIPWGTPQSDKRFHFDHGDCDSYKSDLARVVGPSVNWPSASNLQLSDAVSASGVGQPYAFYEPKLPEGISILMKDEATCYGFYEGKFAFAFQFVGDPHDDGGEAKALAATRSKYPLLKTVAAESWGDPPTQSLAPYLVRYTANNAGYLFRRGETNTRIYLFSQSLMYIPNSYLLAIRTRWKSEYDKAAAAAAEQQRQYEEQQRQAINKAVQ